MRRKEGKGVGSKKGFSLSLLKLKKPPKKIKISCASKVRNSYKNEGIGKHRQEQEKEIMEQIGADTIIII